MLCSKGGITRTKRSQKGWISLGSLKKKYFLIFIESHGVSELKSCMHFCLVNPEYIVLEVAGVQSMNKRWPVNKWRWGESRGLQSRKAKAEKNMLKNKQITTATTKKPS